MALTSAGWGRVLHRTERRGRGRERMQEQVLREEGSRSGPAQACAGERASVHCPWLLPLSPTKTRCPVGHAPGSPGSPGAFTAPPHSPQLPV